MQQNCYLLLAWYQKFYDRNEEDDRDVDDDDDDDDGDDDDDDDDDDDEMANCLRQNWQPILRQK